MKHSLALLPVLGLLAFSQPVTPAAAAMIQAPALSSHSQPLPDLLQVRDGDRDRGRMVIRRDHDGRRDFDGDRRGRGTRYLWGGLPFFFYDGYYHGDCGWLRRRARETGSAYWWSRYRQCRND